MKRSSRNRQQIVRGGAKERHFSRRGQLILGSGKSMKVQKGGFLPLLLRLAPLALNLLK